MKSSELIRILKKDGWFLERQAKGSHSILKHPSKLGRLTVPNHGSAEVAKGLASKILKSAGLK